MRGLAVLDKRLVDSLARVRTRVLHEWRFQYNFHDADNWEKRRWRAKGKKSKNTTFK